MLSEKNQKLNMKIKTQLNILYYFLISSFYKNNKHTINAIRGLHRESGLPRSPKVSMDTRSGLPGPNEPFTFTQWQLPAINAFIHVVTKIIHAYR